MLKQLSVHHHCHSKQNNTEQLKVKLAEAHLQFVHSKEELQLKELQLKSQQALFLVAEKKSQVVVAEANLMADAFSTC